MRKITIVEVMFPNYSGVELNWLPGFVSVRTSLNFTVQFFFQLSTTDITPPNDSDGKLTGGGEGPNENDEEKPVTAAERSLLQKIIRKGLVENKNDIEIQRKDPTSPLYSVKSFEALHL